MIIVCNLADFPPKHLDLLTLFRLSGTGTNMYELYCSTESVFFGNFSNEKGITASPVSRRNCSHNK